MAQTNFTPILLYASSTPTNVPSAGNLTNSATGSEIAINIADKNLFFKDSGGVVNTVPIRQSSTSSNGWLSSTDWNTFNNKAPATSGTSILYGNGSGGFSNVIIGTGITFAGGTLSATGTGGTVTSVTGTAPVVSSGGTTPAISMAAATTSVNGYLTSTDWNTFNNKQPAGTYVTSVGATSPVTSSGGTTPTIAMPAATTSVSGYLTSTDWNTFNNKGSGTVTSVSGTAGRITSTGGATPVIDLASGVATAGTTGSSTLIPVVTIDTYGRVTGITTAANPQGTVTSVTGTSPVVSSGGATPAISMAAATASVNGYLTSTDWNTFNNKGSGTVTSVAALTLGTTGTDLSSTVANGTTTPVITLNVPTASAANRGALSAADWSTFNGKQAALVSGTNIKTVGALTLLGSGDVGTIRVGYGGTGLTAVTAGYIPYGSSSTALATSADGFFFDATNVRLGIFNTAPATTLDAHGTVRATRRGATSQYIEMLATSGGSQLNVSAGSGALSISTDGGTTPMVYLSGSGDLLVGTTSNTIGGTSTKTGVVSSFQFQYGLALGSTQTTSTAYMVNFVFNGTSVGSITSTSTATVYAVTSDRRLKSDIVDLTGSGLFIDSLKPRSFTWNKNNKKVAGFIADEFQEISPDSVVGKSNEVHEDGSPVYQQIDPATPEVIANIVAELQSLRARLKAANL